MIIRPACLARAAARPSAARLAMVRRTCFARCVPGMSAARNQRQLQLAIALDGMGALGLQALMPCAGRIPFRSVS